MHLLWWEHGEFDRLVLRGESGGNKMSRSSTTSIHKSGTAFHNNSEWSWDDGNSHTYRIIWVELEQWQGGVVCRSACGYYCWQCSWWIVATGVVDMRWTADTKKKEAEG